uniref:Uncharacterized protein n=1 Tax=Candidatus Kentrum sp. FM TaxID=2126340 RepID=A0A450TY33_9GAMM|nr:MAG: hypothetical protein BECKFM1743A_GA0114220_107771 [Candidatus Kentron sp. FM]
MFSVSSVDTLSSSCSFVDRFFHWLRLGRATSFVDQDLSFAYPIVTTEKHGPCLENDNLNIAFEASNTIFETQSTELEISNTEFEIPSATFEISNTSFETSNTAFEITE